MCHFKHLLDRVGFLRERHVAYVCYSDMETACSASNPNTEPHNYANHQSVKPENATIEVSPCVGKIQGHHRHGSMKLHPSCATTMTPPPRQAAMCHKLSWPELTSWRPSTGSMLKWRCLDCLVPASWSFYN